MQAMQNVRKIRFAAEHYSSNCLHRHSANCPVCWCLPKQL